VVAVPEKLEEEDAVEDDGPVIHVPLPLNLMLWCMELYSLLLEPSMLFHVLHFVFACLGIWRPFFFCYHLLEIVYRSPTLQVGRRVCVCVVVCACVSVWFHMCRIPIARVVAVQYRPRPRCRAALCALLVECRRLCWQQ
jgi:hypothetical protein